MPETVVFQKASLVIPAMDPNGLGKYWEQPKLDKIEISDEHARMDKPAFKELKDYSNSRPSGVYPGKMWRAFNGEFWWLVWFGHCDDPDKCSVNYRKIIPII